MNVPTQLKNVYQDQSLSMGVGGGSGLKSKLRESNLAMSPGGDDDK